MGSTLGVVSIQPQGSFLGTSGGGGYIHPPVTISIISSSFLSIIFDNPFPLCLVDFEYMNKLDVMELDMVAGGKKTKNASGSVGKLPFSNVSRKIGEGISSNVRSFSVSTS